MCEVWSGVIHMEIGDGKEVWNVEQSECGRGHGEGRIKYGVKKTN